ncbi:MAG: zinc-binding dehydrogenase [Candidatus Riflebacteria bacterium]|nr:zinc-binding dehydrogenase [Candidatus Riflebacteria bacterium]
MKAAILTGLRSPLEFGEVRLPDRLEAGQVLVRIRFSGICGSQLGEIDGVKGEDRFLPHLLGHEGSGEVLETGPGVRHVQAGDHVVLHWRKGNGIEAAPPVYDWDGRRVNAGCVTTFNELAVVSENRLTAIPSDFPLDLAPLFGCAVTTGMGVIANNARLQTGESIVVFGAGGVGLNVIQGAAMVTAHPVIAVDLFDNRLELAAKMGATHLVNASRLEAAAEIRRILGPAGADVVVNNTADTRLTALALDLTRPQGRVVLVGVPRKGDLASLYTLPLHFGKVLTGSHGGESQPAADIPRFVKLYQAGKMNLRDLITVRMPFSAANEAIAGMRNGEIAGRCLLEF